MVATQSWGTEMGQQVVRSWNRWLASHALSSAIVVAIAIGLVGPLYADPQQTAAGPSSSAGAKALGTVKGVAGNTITLAPESGDEIKVTVQDRARVVRVEPGSTDLNNAAPMELQDLQTGDRILVRGAAADGGKTLLAVSVIAMKKADLAEKHARDREEWQRNGVGGLVAAVDPAAGKLQLDTSGLGTKKNVTVVVSKGTVLRRYAPGSVNFDDATPAPIDQIKVGDQLRARGARSDEGNTVSADEVVSGSFRNIAGTVASIEATAGTMVVNDLATKKAVVIKVGPGTQLKKLPQPMAQRIAARLRGNGASAASSGPPDSARPGDADARNAMPSTKGPTGAEGRPAKELSAPGSMAAGGASGPGDRGGGGDLQQAIARMPAATLADLQKGDAVMIVATGDSGGAITAITLLAGVEPILQASPNGGQSLLTPWSLSSAPGGDAAAQ